MTFEEKFGKLSKKLIKADTSKFGGSFAIQITMNDEDCGGTFFAAYSDGVYRVEPYNYFDNTASVNVLAETLEKLTDKKLTVEEALEQGILFIDGSVDHVIGLFNGFEKKKTAAKKTAAKKPAAKKTAAKKTAKKAEKAKTEVKEVKAEVKKDEPVKKEEPKKAAEKAAEAPKAEPEKKPVKKDEPKKAEPKAAKKK